MSASSRVSIVTVALLIAVLALSLAIFNTLNLGRAHAESTPLSAAQQITALVQGGNDVYLVLTAPIFSTLEHSITVGPAATDKAFALSNAGSDFICFVTDEKNRTQHCVLTANIAYFYASPK